MPYLDPATDVLFPEKIEIITLSKEESFIELAYPTDGCGEIFYGQKVAEGVLPPGTTIKQALPFLGLVSAEVSEEEIILSSRHQKLTILPAFPFERFERSLVLRTGLRSVTASVEAFWEWTKLSCVGKVSVAIASSEVTFLSPCGGTFATLKCPIQSSIEVCGSVPWEFLWLWGEFFPNADELQIWEGEGDEEGEVFLQLHSGDRYLGARVSQENANELSELISEMNWHESCQLTLRRDLIAHLIPLDEMSDYLFCSLSVGGHGRKGSIVSLSHAKFWEEKDEKEKSSVGKIASGDYYEVAATSQPLHFLSCQIDRAIQLSSRTTISARLLCNYRHPLLILDLSKGFSVGLNSVEPFTPDTSNPSGSLVPHMIAIDDQPYNISAIDLAEIGGNPPPARKSNLPLAQLGFWD